MVCLDVSRHTVSKSIMQISLLIFLDLSLHLATNYISKKKIAISFHIFLSVSEMVGVVPQAH